MSFDPAHVGQPHRNCTGIPLPDSTGATAETNIGADSSDDGDDSCSEAQLYLLAFVTLCREHYGVKDACMEDFKQAIVQYAHAKDKATLKRISRRFGVPTSEIGTIAGLINSNPFEGMETKTEEYNMADAAFKPVYNCKPRLMGHDEKGRPQTVVDFAFPDQLGDLLSDGDLYTDAHREVIDDGVWSSDVQHGGLWKAHPMVRAGVKPYLVSIWMDGGEITGFMGPCTQRHMEIHLCGMEAIKFERARANQAMQHAISIYMPRKDIQGLRSACNHFWLPRRRWIVRRRYFLG